jgi:hypothetical protein
LKNFINLASQAQKNLQAAGKWSVWNFFRFIFERCKFLSFIKLYIFDDFFFSLI